VKALLGTRCGLAGTAIGSIDFTGCWFLEEPHAVFRPALTLAVDDAERRWIAEMGDKDLPASLFPHNYRYDHCSSADILTAGETISLSRGLTRLLNCQ
jgi:hypothetical protein